MIPSKADISITSTMDAVETIQMGIDQKSLTFLQKILTDLYSDPELAVIREYSTNARDSHLEAGIKTPIEVNTPTVFDPSIHIKDHGIGLSLDDIKNVYSLYGASTKRQSATANGMLGLGCKSALTYTDQFTIRSVKDGMLVIVLVSRDEFGAGAMEILHNAPTDESNGVEIVVPSKQGNGFKLKAETFFSYWEKSPVPVILNGKSPEFIKASWVTDNIALTEGVGYYDRQKAKLHMAGVTYNAESGVDWNKLNLSYNTNVIFFAEDGAVDFTPSREELHYTAKTKLCVDQFVEDLRTGLLKAMQAEIDAQRTHSEAIQTYKRWTKTFSVRPDFNYKGVKPQGELPVFEDYALNRYGTNSYHDRSRGMDLFAFVINDSDNRIIVTEKTEKKLSTSQRAKLRTWATNENLDHTRFVFVEKDTGSPWTDHITHVTWQEILNTKPIPNKDRLYSEPDHYIYVNGRSRVVISPDTGVDVSEVIAYAYLSDISPTNEPLIGSVAELAGIKIYGVPKAKLKEFQKKYPKAVYYKEALEEAVQRKFLEFTKEDRELIKNYNSVSDLPRSLAYLKQQEVDLIQDPVLRQGAELYIERRGIGVRHKDLIDSYRKFEKLREEVGNYIALDQKEDWLDLTTTNPAYATMHEKYPLIDGGNSYDFKTQEHILIYVNAAYNQGDN